jgi:putative chitinase
MTTPLQFTLSLSQLEQILPTNKQSDDWLVVLLDNLPQFDVSTPQRAAQFLAQTSHESCDYTRLRENLNYRASSLIKTWPRRFNATNAPAYEHNQEKIANRVYANRMGNGDEASGDGFKYRGRGLIQLTGKSNYSACSLEVYGDDRLVQHPELVETDMDAALDSALFFWHMYDLNHWADEGDTTKVTRLINGGDNGLDDRINRYNKILTILGVTLCGSSQF